MRPDRTETAGLLVRHDGRRGSSALFFRATALVAVASVVYACSGWGSKTRAGLLQREPGRRTMRARAGGGSALRSALADSICFDFQNRYIESLPAPPGRLQAPWKDARVMPRHWIDQVHRLGDPFGEGVEVEVRERCPESRYCAPNVSYAHVPMGQAQSRIRDSYCDFVNETDVFGGYYNTFAAQGDMRRRPPLVKPEVNETGTWRRQHARREWHGAGGQVDSSWYESSPGVWSSSNWEQEAENASASAPGGGAASDNAGADYRARYNDWLARWDKKLRYVDPTHTDMREGSFAEFAQDQQKWEDRAKYNDWWRGYGCDTKGCGEHPHPYKQPMGGGEFEVMRKWADDHHKWDKSRAFWDKTQIKDDWDSTKRGRWRVEPGEEPSSLPYRRQPYGQKAYRRYLKAYGDWGNNIYSWTRSQRKDPVSRDIQYYTQAPSDNNGVTGRWSPLFAAFQPEHSADDEGANVKAEEGRNPLLSSVDGPAEISSVQGSGDQMVLVADDKGAEGVDEKGEEDGEPLQISSADGPGTQVVLEPL